MSIAVEPNTGAENRSKSSGPTAPVLAERRRRSFLRSVVTRVKFSGRVMLIVGVAVASAMTFLGSAKAASDVLFYPPMGQWLSHGYPSANSICFSWSHSIVTDANRSSSTMFVSYYDVYGGSASTGGIQIGGVQWRNLQLADPWDSSKTISRTAPLFTSFSSDWTAWINSTFNETSSQYAYGVTNFGLVSQPGCQGTSTGIYGP
jgi:hypothetical protein